MDVEPVIEVVYLAVNGIEQPPVTRSIKFTRKDLAEAGCSFVPPEGEISFTHVIRHLRECGFRICKSTIWISPSAILRIADLT